MGFSQTNVPAPAMVGRGSRRAGASWTKWLGRSLALPAVIFAATSAFAQTQSVHITPPPPALTDGFKMGTARRPDGSTVTLDSRSLRLDGQPWTPVMGEFHYTRYPENEWREELLKMKAGGVDIVSTYVFWIHHKEIEGQFDWTGSRNLRHFIQLCQEVGLKTFVRCGPWDHGEARNGGLPDWLLQKGWKTRSDDTNYLGKARIFYGEIAKQLNGLFWKDGGPIVGIQFENEYKGPAQHLMTLKSMGQELELDAPIYTRTGWDQPSGHLPFGELVPLYGVYAEGFWDRQLTPMPNGYWKGFHFSNFRMDDATFAAIPGQGGFQDPADAPKYPYLTCEIGGGMMNSYHRRILVDPRDSESTTLIKLGSGGVSLGYYMYHGGVNPEGKLTTLMESQATGYWNDMPVKNYDFQAPLGQYGQIRPQYHLLRRLHLFMHEWGSSLAAMPAALPDAQSFKKDDVDTLRWSARSDGNSGFVFVNNYERLRELPPKKDVQFSINLPGGAVVFPDKPVTVPSDESFIWPFNLDLGHGVRLNWATVRPLTALTDGSVKTVFFSEVSGVPPQLAVQQNGKETVQRDFKSGTGVALKLAAADGATIQIVVLDDEQSLSLWKQEWQGRDRVFLTRAGLVCDGPTLRLSSTNCSDLSVAVFPGPSAVESKGHPLKTEMDGVFQKYVPAVPSAEKFLATVASIEKAGPPRDIPMGTIDRPVATAPLDADFAKAAVWRVKLPDDLDLSADPILRFHYTGDVARILLNGQFITDDFYNGNPFDLGLRRHAPEIQQRDLRIAILPLRKDAPIYLAQKARPDFGTSASVVSLQSVEIIPRYQVELTAR